MQRATCYRNANPFTCSAQEGGTPCTSQGCVLLEHLKMGQNSTWESLLPGPQKHEPECLLEAVCSASAPRLEEADPKLDESPNFQGLCCPATTTLAHSWQHPAPNSPSMDARTLGHPPSTFHSSLLVWHLEKADSK